MKTIVSLTTIHSRLFIVKYTLDSLLGQDYKPDLIVFNISHDPYLLDKGIGEIPDWLRDKRFEDIQVNWVPNDGPYRKLLPVIPLATDEDLIVTADDDQIYAPNWLSGLVAEARVNPNSIICGRARRPSKNIFGRYQSYDNWPLVVSSCTSIDLLPTGNCGIVYRKNLLDLDFIFDEKYRNLAPTTDDLWFREASYRLGVKVTVVSGVANSQASIEAPQGGALSDQNTSFRVLQKAKGILKLASRVLRILKAYLGITLNKNDEAFKKIKGYSDSGKIKSVLEN
ncbi:Glycosyl transferase family 2 [Paenibacillus sophorae]|uniref:Glycosyl transferase family 2 n=1 Tax=Paenibacillus sophorae TaxID=1333845 RepID=A0A1H8QIG4_9BACL|nr:glycosyltransferase family A protein [Paenibacillus sophorae]QWU15122.1 glycosyltransferase family 2 protein [Paenibacillus sophorae]SEO53583.1 Glycosyl transferase family 2 [Paenibacillus sophorae]